MNIPKEVGETGLVINKESLPKYELTNNIHYFRMYQQIYDLKLL